MTMKNHCAAPLAAKVCLLCVIIVAAMATGCIQMAALWANMTGGDVVEPEFVITKGPLLILIDDRASLVTEPRSLRDVQKAISEAFIEYRVNNMVVPFQDWRRLQQSAKHYDRLSIREIGEKLGADQILYLRVDRFTLKAEPGAPLFKGEFAVRAKILSTERKNDIRLWPRHESGRRVMVTTPPESSDGDRSSAEIAKELATKLGEAVAKLFYEHRELD